MIRTLVDRFHGHHLSQGWEAARTQLQRLLLDLERILGVLHPKVEYPSATLSTRATCSTNTTINSTSFTDITGATVTLTPDVTSKFLVTAHFDVECSALGGAIGDIFACGVAVNGTLDAARGAWVPTIAGARLIISNSFVISATAGTAYTLKLQARTTNAPTTFLVRATHTGFTLLAVPEPYRVPN